METKTMTEIEKDLLRLKSSIQEKRDKIIESKSVKQQLEKDLESTMVELKALGIEDVDDINPKLTEISEEIHNLYDEVSKIVESWGVQNG